MFRVVNCILLLFIYMQTVVDLLPRLGKRELICLLSFTCNYVVFVWRGFLFLWVLGMGYVILLWHSLSLPYNYFTIIMKVTYMVTKRSRGCFRVESIYEIYKRKLPFIVPIRFWACPTFYCWHWICRTRHSVYV